MAGQRHRRLIVLLAVACIAVTVAGSWLIDSCTADDATPAGAPIPLPGFCMGISLSVNAGHGISAALGVLLGLVCRRVYRRFADGGGDEEEMTAAVEMAGYVAIRGDDAEAAGGAKN